MIKAVRVPVGYREPGEEFRTQVTCDMCPIQETFRATDCNTLQMMMADGKWYRYGDKEFCSMECRDKYKSCNKV